ncbi:MAG: helix-turn-helix domain-containing protein [Deltaproteobacteria bacterium]|nr:helix-turn-helix domain-containing protein [Deltaproteobacteria bacterium]
MQIKNRELFERMLMAGKLKNYSELAKTVGLSPQAISNYRKKDEISPKLIFKFAETYNISIDWLLTGIGDMYSRMSSSERVCTIALVEKARGKDNGSYSYAMGQAVLDTEEIVYVGKLLTILRSTESVAGPSIKTNIDAFYMTVKA